MKGRHNVFTWKMWASCILCISRHPSLQNVPIDNKYKRDKCQPVHLFASHHCEDLGESLRCVCQSQFGNGIDRFSPGYLLGMKQLIFLCIYEQLSYRLTILNTYFDYPPPPLQKAPINKAENGVYWYSIRFFHVL